MNEIYRFLSKVCDYAEQQLDKDKVLLINVTTHTSEGEKPGCVRRIDKDLVLCVQFMEPKDANSKSPTTEVDARDS
jgi:hypothetical protein